jgi:hypothetical protein
MWSKQYHHYDVDKWLSTGDGITEPGDGKKWVETTIGSI